MLQGCSVPVMVIYECNVCKENYCEEVCVPSSHTLAQRLCLDLVQRARCG